MTFDDKGGSMLISLTPNALWYCHVSVTVVDYVDFVRFDADVNIAIPEPDAGSVPWQALDELAAFGAEVAERVHVWNGWVSVGANWLEVINGFDWYRDYARSSVSGYPWTVLVPAPARAQLDLAATDRLSAGVTVRDVGGASNGAVIVTAGQSPASMTPDDLLAWRDVFADAMAPIANVRLHNWRIENVNPPFPTGIVDTDWQIINDGTVT